MLIGCKRQDLIPPCAKGCPDRQQGCQDRCRKGEYMDYLAAKKRLKEEQQRLNREASTKGRVVARYRGIDLQYQKRR